MRADLQHWQAELKMREADLWRAEQMWKAQLITQQQLEHDRYSVAGRQVLPPAPGGRSEKRRGGGEIGRNWSWTRPASSRRSTGGGAALRARGPEGRARRPSVLGDRTAPLNVKFTLPQEFPGKIKSVNWCRWQRGSITKRSTPRGSRWSARWWIRPAEPSSCRHRSWRTGGAPSRDDGQCECEAAMNLTRLGRVGQRSAPAKTAAGPPAPPSQTGGPGAPGARMARSTRCHPGWASALLFPPHRNATAVVQLFDGERDAGAVVESPHDRISLDLSLDDIRQFVEALEDADF